MSIQSRSEQILQDTIDGVLTNVKDKSRIEHLLVQLNDLIVSGGGGGGYSDYAVDLFMTINSSTFVITAQLINKDGDPIGTPQTIDLPMESVVVGASYDNVNKALIITLQNGNMTSVPIGDLVYGLQPLIDAQHKLDADLVDDTNATNKFVSDSDKTTWNAKQDAISDLSTIRSNASAGAEAATVVQGIDETSNNYIELKSGQREYLDTTVPTGNIPTGSVGTGFDEGVYSYKSGTKVSEGEPNLTYGKQFSFYGNGQPLTDYTIYGADGGVGERTANLFDGNFPDLSGTIQYMPVYVGNISVTLETTASASSSYDAQIFLLEGNVASGASSAANGVWAGNSRRVAAVDGYITIAYRNLGKLAVPLSNAETWLFEHFQLPIICGNTTTNIYIDSPLDDGDSIDYTTSQVDIPTVDGANNLICDTTVQPSKVSLTYTGWHSDLDDTTARIEALENAPAPSGGMTYDTLYEGTTASSYPYPLSHPITDYKFIIIAVGYSNVYTSTVIPVSVWNTITGGGDNYTITVDTAKLTVNASEIVPRSANNRIVYGIYGIK